MLRCYATGKAVIVLLAQLISDYIIGHTSQATSTPTVCCVFFLGGVSAAFLVPLACRELVMDRVLGFKAAGIMLVDFCSRRMDVECKNLRRHFRKTLRKHSRQKTV